MTFARRTRICSLAALAGGMLLTGAGWGGDSAFRSFDGAWLYTRDVDDGTVTAFEVAGSSMLYLTETGRLVAFARGWWTVDPYANPDANGVFHVKTEVGETVVIDGPGYETEVSEIELRMTGPDTGDLFLAGETTRRGIIKRIACKPVIAYVERTDPPPAGCQWRELQGLGYDGLTGECRWDEDWAINWETISKDPEGMPWPMACLLAEPVEFP